jgi:hypothetical protein
VANHFAVLPSICHFGKSIGPKMQKREHGLFIRALKRRKTWSQVIFVTVLSTLLFGCVKTFFYSNIDWFVIDYIDDYVTLNREQEAILEDRISRLAAWHKSEELPQYISQLKELETWNSRLSQQEIENNRDALRSHYMRLLHKAAPDMFSLSLLLTESQQQEFLTNIKQRYRKKDAKYLNKSEQDVREVIYESAIEWLEQWIGKPTKEQRVRVRLLARDLELNTAEWREYRGVVYNELESLFQSQEDRSRYQQIFMNLVFQPENYYGHGMDQKIERNIEKTDMFVLDIAKSMSDKQWQHFYREIREWRELAEDLME